MPEIKHQFTGGKMNKDVDERLVPNGEYRDAMNIQVSTSEGSDVGTIQNILGNSELILPFPATEHKCVGSVSDEKLDSSYFFLAGPRFAHGQDEPVNGVWSRDYIIRLKDNVVTTVFTDVKLVISMSVPGIGGSGFAFDYVNKTINIPMGQSQLISVGDTLERIVNKANGATKLTNHVVTYVGKGITMGDPDFVVLDKLDYAFPAHTVCDLFFRSGCLSFDVDRLVTGINIIDDMLLWTDGVTEPKKINITRSIKGTDALGYTRTLLLNDAQNITLASNVAIKEKHITVIKKSPAKPPTLKSLTSLRENGVQGEVLGLDFTTGAFPATLKSQGDTLEVSVAAINNDNIPDIKKGDVILFNSMSSGLHPPENYEVRAVVNHHPVVNITSLELNITLMSISGNTPAGSSNFYVAVEEFGYNLFERQFPRFACRYRYEDGEYSSIGPFSEVAFLPGHFSYHPTEAYNKGMVNNLKSLKLQDFIPRDIPKDVIAVDLLYKDELSPNIYTVTSVTPLDDAWGAEGSFPASFGSYEITTENVYATIPSNQSLRVWDNVPRAALAQEVIGSRVTYANYLQNYNIETLPAIIASITPRDWSDGGMIGRKSIKSLRTYNVGIVYGDEYGRETPVFTSNNSNQIVSKDNAGSSTLLKAEVVTTHPSWAKYYKFFVKQTSSEYYNLALGRVYDAEDGNIWLAFPSVDRNKVDEDTFLILKKGVENQSASTKEGRYKIIAIENEAPEYIKTSFTTIARPIAWPTTNTEVVFGGAGAGNTAREPVVGGTSFYLAKNRWTQDPSLGNRFGMPDLYDQWQERGSDELYVSFIGNLKLGGGGVESKKYLITSVVNVDGADAILTNVHVFQVFLSTPIDKSDDWISRTPGLTGFWPLNGTQHRPVIYKKQIKNKPEFDGRFFVKIKNDEVASEYLTDNIVEDIAWKIAASTNIFYLRDSDANGHQYNLASDTWGNVFDDLGCSSSTNCLAGTQMVNGVGGVANMHGDVVDGVYTESQWRKVLEWGSNNSDDPEGRWFIDQASFAGTQNNWTGSFSGANFNLATTDLTSTQKYTNNIVHHDTQNWGTGFSLGKQWQTGISGSFDANLPNSREHRFKLSYSSINPDKDNFPVLSNRNWMVGKSGNSYEVLQSEFVSQIKPGAKFRMKDTPSIIYTITSFTTTRLYNYRAALPTSYTDAQIGTATYNAHDTNNDWSKWKWLQDRASANNRRLCYDIVYTIDSEDLADDLSVNSALNNVNALNSGGLQFLEKYDPDKVDSIAPYPAIFETEPKDSADLDIYYEASGRIPTSIVNGDGEMLVPIGSTLRIASSVLENAIAIGEELDLGITANGWGGKNFLTLMFQHDIINIYPQITSAQATVLWPLGIGSVMSFDTPDGGISYVKLLVANYDVTTLLIKGFVVEAVNQHGLGWFNCWDFGNGVESNRIGDTYNKAYLANGAKASTTLDKKYEEEHMAHGLIYSGLYNSTSGVNDLNQFIAAEKITKDLNPIYGSIQKLHARSTADGDLIVLCEDRILKILADRDALFNADGNPQLVATNNVLGQAIPFAGEFGISTNPESFASESYRAYFTDRVRGTVMRLSRDGLTPISNHGMKDWFRDNLKLSSKILGSYDDKKDEYNITLLPREQQTYTTLLTPVVKSTTIVLIPSS